MKLFDLSAITVDLGYGDFDLSPVKELCEQLSVPYTIIPTEISKILFDIRKESNPCALCAKMRKGALNTAAKESGCNKLEKENPGAKDRFFHAIIEGNLAGGSFSESFSELKNSKNGKEVKR